MTEQFVNSNVAPTRTPDTTLNNGGVLGAGATSLVVASVPTYVATAPFRIRIDNEFIIVGAVAGTTWSSLTRGVEGSTAAAHADSSGVYLVLTREALLTILHRLAESRATTNDYTPIVDGGDFHEIPSINLGDENDGSNGNGVPTYFCINMPAALAAAGGQFFEFQINGNPVFWFDCLTKQLVLYGQTDLQVYGSITQVGSGEGVTLGAATIALTNLPTSDPGTGRKLWVDAGVLKITAP